jgi:LuxR family transcriptional regulator, maltose regulon positive regulatory protein
MLALLHDAARSRDDVARRHARRLLDAAHGASTGRTEDTAADSGERLADPLSDRELDVLRLLDSDLTGPEIARRLFVSVNTLRSHTKHIFTKLDVNNRSAAVRRGHRLGLL